MKISLLLLITARHSTQRFSILTLIFQVVTTQKEHLSSADFSPQTEHFYMAFVFARGGGTLLFSLKLQWYFDPSAIGDSLTLVPRNLLLILLFFLSAHRVSIPLYKRYAGGAMKCLKNRGRPVLLSLMYRSLCILVYTEYVCTRSRFVELRCDRNGQQPRSEYSLDQCE